MCLFLVR